MKNSTSSASSIYINAGNTCGTATIGEQSRKQHYVHATLCVGWQ